MDRQRPTGAVATAVVLAVIFGFLAHAVMRGQTEHFDLAVRDTVHAWASPYLTYAMRGFTLLGSPTLLVLMGMLAAWQLLAFGKRRVAVLLVVAALGGEAIDEALKLFFERARPAAFFGLAEPLSYSFPSGHSMASCCFYGALALIAAAHPVWRRWRWAIYTGAAALIFLVGLSRIYLGVHYPTDVLGGFTAAVAWLTMLWGFRGQT